MSRNVQKLGLLIFCFVGCNTAYVRLMFFIYSEVVYLLHQLGQRSTAWFKKKKKRGVKDNDYETVKRMKTTMELKFRILSFFFFF